MQTQKPQSFVDKIEENLIAILLGAMTMITFANVVARKGFNSNILWGLEATVFLFGWLVLLGASYAVKKGAHLGVDALINVFSAQTRRIVGLVAIVICVAFSLLLLKGSWDYFANFANLPATEGRWFPLGFEDKYLSKGWYELDDIPHPAILKWMEDVFNEGESYNKMPRMIPYVVLPISSALLTLRFVQAGIAVWKGEADRIVASHEVEDDLENARAEAGENT